MQHHGQTVVLHCFPGLLQLFPQPSLKEFLMYICLVQQVCLTWRMAKHQCDLLLLRHLICLRFPCPAQAASGRHFSLSVHRYTGKYWEHSRGGDENGEGGGGSVAVRVWIQTEAVVVR